MDDLKKKLINKTAMAYSLGRTALYLLEKKPLHYIRKVFDSNAALTPPEDFEQAAEVQLKKLLQDDADNISQGIYPSHVLSLEKPQVHLKRLIKIWSDAVFIAYRRNQKQHKKFTRNAQKLLPTVPDYYQRNFHNQTDGYLSEQSAEIYDHQVDLLFSGSADAMRRSILKPLKKYQQKKKNLKILEIGCGAGSFTKFLSKSFPQSKIYALDISQPYIKAAQKKLREYNNISFINSQAEALDFKDKSFDVIVSVFLFHELPLDIRKLVIKESNRVLAPGGFFGLVDSLQIHDQPELNWALDNFPKILHEPFYKNYVSNPMEDLIAEEFGISASNVSTHFLSKCIHLEKTL